MKKAAFSIISATLLVSCVSSGSSSSPDLASAIDGIRQKYGVPALAAMELKDGGIAAYSFSGVRKLGDNTPITSSDQFHLGSDTKAMTATLIGLLIDESKLRWDSSLGELFPDLKMDPGYKSVTVAMLGAHRAGLPANPNPAYEKLWESLWSVDPIKGRQEILETILANPPVSTPGSQYSYSNVGYVILGSIIEKVSGLTYEQFMQENLFKPLGMNSCGFGPMGDPSANPPDEPWGHALVGKALTPVAPTLQGDNPPAYNSAARVHCSLADWGKFLQMHVDGFNGKSEFLRPETFSKLHTPYPGQDYTYGGWISANRDWAGGPVLTHEGSNTFNVALVWLAPLKNEIFMSVSNAPIPLARPAVNDAIDYMIENPPGGGQKLDK